MSGTAADASAASRRSAVPIHVDGVLSARDMLFAMICSALAGATEGLERTLGQTYTLTHLDLVWDGLFDLGNDAIG